MSRLGSPQAVSRRVAIAKPRNDIYVALLGIALGAVIIACILLAMEMSHYEWSTTPKVAVAPAPVGAEAARMGLTRGVAAPRGFASDLAPDGRVEFELGQLVTRRRRRGLE